MTQPPTWINSNILHRRNGFLQSLGGCIIPMQHHPTTWQSINLLTLGLNRCVCIGLLFSWVNYMSMAWFAIAFYIIISRRVPLNKYMTFNVDAISLLLTGSNGTANIHIYIVLYRRPILARQVLKNMNICHLFFYYWSINEHKFPTIDKCWNWIWNFCLE